MNWIKRILAIDNQPLIDTINRQVSDIEVAKHNNDELVKRYNSLNASIEALKIEHDLQIESLEANIESGKLEYYWNHKIKPLTAVYYPARNGNNSNVIRYFITQTSDVPTVDGKDNDTKANNALIHTARNVTYTSDPKENWQWANETIKRKKGDCEDGAILMANIMVKSGIPYWRIRLNAGDVKGGGHAYVTYLKEADNKWYVLDWCYWYTESVNFKKKWVDAKKYFGIWFSWNSKYGFKKDKLDR